MNIDLGNTIRALRLRDGRTQEELASSLGVSPQAVSRWEKMICYPDMELIPSLANYFGVTIDELFGYENERTKKIDALAERINGMNRQNNGADVNLDECISLAREALIEFPGDEKLTLALASVLYNAGYVRRGEHHVEGPGGYSLYDVDRHRKYPEWQEAAKLYEKVLSTLTGGEMRQQAVLDLSSLYANLGEHEKAMRLADSAPGIHASKTFLRITAYDGKEAVAARNEALLETVRISAELIESIVLSDRNIEPGTAADLLGNAISMLGLICTDGFYGRLYGFIACLEMLRSYYFRLAGSCDEAFLALDRALDNAKKSDSLPGSGADHYTSPLLCHVKIELPAETVDFAPELPEDWPWWSVPQYSRVRSELEADPRWQDWVRRCKEA